MHTAVWLIVLTMIVVGAIPALLIWLTTMPHPKLLLDMFQYQPALYFSSHPGVLVNIQAGLV